MSPVDVPFTIDHDDVLAQSTRARLFTLLADMKRTAGTAELFGAEFGGFK